MSGEYLDDKQQIVSMQYISDENCVCITTSKEDALLIDMQQTILECVGSVDAGLVTSLWSPDYELLVLKTGIVCNGFSMEQLKWYKVPV